MILRFSYMRIWNIVVNVFDFTFLQSLCRSQFMCAHSRQLIALPSVKSWTTVSCKRLPFQKFCYACFWNELPHLSCFIYIFFTNPSTFRDWKVSLSLKARCKCRASLLHLIFSMMQESEIADSRFREVHHTYHGCLLLSNKEGSLISGN